MQPAYKICISLGADWRTQWVVHAAETDLMELRIDLMFQHGETTVQMTEAIAPLLHKYSHKIVLTCRPGAIPQEVRHDLFLALLSPAPPAYIDLEYDTPHCFSAPLYNAVQRYATQIIASYHNFNTTPHTPQLCAVADTALLQGAHLVKIVTLCQNSKDEERLLSLYSIPRFANRIIAFSLGEHALSSRLHAAASGAPILYVAPDNGALTALGQPRFSQFTQRLSDFFDNHHLCALK